ncbi:MAG: hypothetical protein RBT16_14935 [Desulfococcus multivorans]|jgi:hypothetical protein|nr:hypothetical protein [Desulfococcus multivorans]
MKCEKCGKPISPGEDMAVHGRTLCEDCAMDAMSPAKACDPWAVHLAKSFSGEAGGTLALTEPQKKILRILSETGGIPPEALAREMDMAPSDLERELAALRHMEKIRGELRDGQKVIRLW